MGVKTDVIIYEKHRLNEQWNKWVWCIGYGYGYGYGFLSVEKISNTQEISPKRNFSLTL
jgi:hypothetical protein